MVEKENPVGCFKHILLPALAQEADANSVASEKLDSSWILLVGKVNILRV